MNGRFLYVFLDEAGNFDFSPGGTKYFILSAISKERPFRAYQEMTELKWDRVLASLGGEFGMAITLDDTKVIPIPMGGDGDPVPTFHPVELVDASLRGEDAAGLLARRAALLRSAGAAR